MLDGAAQRSAVPSGRRGNGTAALIIKGIHFFLTTSVVSPTDRLKQLGMLKGGGHESPGNRTAPRDFHLTFFL